MNNFEHIDKIFYQTREQMQRMSETLSKVVEDPQKINESEDYNDTVEEAPKLPLYGLCMRLYNL